MLFFFFTTSDNMYAEDVIEIMSKEVEIHGK
jgi:hypothetical protein